MRFCQSYPEIGVRTARDPAPRDAATFSRVSLYSHSLSRTTQMLSYSTVKYTDV